MCRTSRNSPAPLTLLQTFPADNSSARSDEPQAATQNSRSRRRWVAAGGAAAITIPAGSGLALGIEGKPGAVLLLALAAAVTIVTAILSAVTTMYEARQETRRKEIECRGTDTFIQALTRCMDDAHAYPANPSIKESRETARIRASARHLLTAITPSITNVMRPGQTTPSSGREKGATQAD